MSTNLPHAQHSSQHMHHFAEQAKAAQKRKDFRNAIRYYDRAIAQASSPQLHDNRAECHTALNDLDSALTDAKATIKQAKLDPTGYLRAGKILLLMRRESVALEVLSHGLKNVKHAGDTYQALRKLHADTLAKLKPMKNVDPLTVLPVELALYVLQWLSFRQLMVVSSLSKGWHSFITSNPSLWTHLDLHGARKKVSQKFVFKAIKCSKQGITRVDLDNLQYFDISLATLVRTCQLTHVDLWNKPLLGHTFKQCMESATHIKTLNIHDSSVVESQIIRNAVNRVAGTLVTLKCSVADVVTPFDDTEFPKLVHLDLQWRRPSVSSFFPSKNMAGLQTLRLDLQEPNFQWNPALHVFEPLTSLKKLDVSYDKVFLEGMKLPQSLQSLIIRFNSAISRRSNPWYTSSDRPGQDLCNLSHLELLTPGLNDLAQLVDCFFSAVKAPRCSDITTLIISNCDFSNITIRSDVFQRLFSHLQLKSTQNLGLPRALGFDDSLLESIGSFMRSLTVLDLEDTNVTGYGVQEILARGKLIELNLNGCSAVSRDLVESARSRGVRVRHALSR